MQHNKINKLIWPYISGELDTVQLKVFEDHLRKCKQCRTEVENVKVIEEFFTTDKIVVPDHRFFEKITERLQSGDEGIIRDFNVQRHNLLIISRKLAAIVIIGLLTGVFLVRWSGLWNMNTNDANAESSLWAYEKIMGEDEITGFESYLSHENIKNNENTGE